MRPFNLRWSGLAASTVVIVSVACSRGPAPSAAASAAPAPPAQSGAPTDVATAAPVVMAPGTGWIEGTIIDANGVPPVVAGSGGVPITLKADGEDVHARSNPKGGGFFAIRNLKPGVYEMFVEASHPPDNYDPLRPVRVFGIAVEAGKRTVLQIKVQPGRELEEIGQPVMTTQKFVVISEELERLQAQVDALTKK